MNPELPIAIQKLLWDADLHALDQDVHKQLIIERVLNHGTLADWRWLVERYGTSDIRAVLAARDVSSRSSVRSESRQLASLILQ